MSESFKNIDCKGKQFISIFASGMSILNIPKEEIHEIKQKSFTIFMNYAPINFDENEIDLLIFSDKKVTSWLADYTKEHLKKYKWLSREKAFVKGQNDDIFNQVDYWFHDCKDFLKGNYTLIWLLQMLQHKRFHDKTLLLFGVDMKAEGYQEVKWYDKFLNYDYMKRGQKYPIDTKLNQCREQLELYIKKENVWNCNLTSNLNYFKKKHWKEILN